MNKPKVQESCGQERNLCGVCLSNKLLVYIAVENYLINGTIEQLVLMNKPKVQEY